MECSHGSHDTEYCIYLGCIRVKIQRRALALYEVVEAQLKDPASVEVLEAKRILAGVVIP